MKNFALAGNPNCGKTTLFNALTGATAHVGNWPGVTVDKKEGVYKGGSENVAIVDLPGIYSLSPYTPEEVISRNFILDEKPSGIINIVDATNLERNLYLTTQILEMDVPVIIALNMMDAVEKAGDRVDAKTLEKVLGVPVVEISALKGTGIKQLMDRAIAMPSERKGCTVLKDALGSEIAAARAFYEERGQSSPLFHAIKLLESDEIELRTEGAEKALSRAVGGADMEAVIADERYKYISSNLASAKVKADKEALTKSDKIDRVLTHRIWAIPIFVVVLFAIFHLTFSEDLLYIGAICNAAGSPLPTVEELGYEGAAASTIAVFYDGAVFSPGVILFNALDTATSSLTEVIAAAMEGAAADWATGLVCDGILGGIFAVLGFLPQILFLFLFFSILEDTGYMARIAFVLDRIFRRFGLSGRAFMPMIMGFGCSLPATINTRTLADEKERTATIRVIPFFSCGAKLPILTAIAGGIVMAFGVGNADVITFLMYILGVCTAIIAVLLMRNTTLKGETPPFIMELPAYHLPGFRNLMLHLWDKTKHFVKKAFTIIFASTIVIWLFSHLSWAWRYLPDEEMQDSILASIGMFLQPVFTPLGFGSQLGNFGWVFAVAAITGLIAKENVIATFTTLALCIGAYVGEGTEDGVEEVVGLINIIAADSGVAQGQLISALIAFIAFNMTTIPCFAACATARAELPEGKFKWTLLFWVVTSYTVGTIIYTVGSWWWTLFIWLAVFAGITALIVLRNLGKFDICSVFRRNKRE